MVGRISNGDEVDSVGIDGPSTTDGDDSDEVPEEYIVERVEDHAIIDGSMHYYLKWKNYPSDKNTWEPVEHLDCDDLIAQYHERLKKRTPVKEKPAAEEKPRGNSLEKAKKQLSVSKAPKAPKGRRGKRTPQNTSKNGGDDSDDDDVVEEKGKETEEDDDEDEEYVVEKILDSRVVDGQKEYFVKWKDYGEEHNSWEPVENIFAKNLIKDYEANLVKIAADKNKKRKTSDAGPASKKKVKQQPAVTGFARGLDVKRIVGATNVNGSLEFVLEWKGCDEYDIVDNKTCRAKIPQMVLDFYEKSVVFND